MNLLKKILKRRYSSSMNYKGVDFVKNGLRDEAKKCFQEAIDVFPKNSQAHINMCNILADELRFAEAGEHIETALTCFTNSKMEQDAYYARGVLKLNQNKYYEAIDDFKKCLEVYHPDCYIYRNFIIANEAYGEWQKALEYLEESRKYGQAVSPFEENSSMQKAFESPEFLRLLNSRDVDWNCSEAYDSEREGFSDFHDQISDFITSKLDTSKKLVFFAGSGISRSFPSCLPTAREILNEIFYYMTEIDQDDLSKVMERKELDAIRNAGAFEPIFQALKDRYGYMTLRFVELLEGGHPNIHHFMLAHALKNGHVVITTNFDTQIEQAWKMCFPGKSLKVLISDKDFKNSTDNKSYGGVLAKIHGDKDDLNSVAITIDSIASNPDKATATEDYNNLVDAKFHSQRIHPKSFLSPPKALFLRDALKQFELFAMGYSGSDVHDIMPILASETIDTGGIWTNYSHHEDKGAQTWQKKRENRHLLKPHTEKEEAFNITVCTSRYFLNKWNVTDINDIAVPEKGSIPSFTELFKAWIFRFRLRPGDGLYFYARLSGQKGNWELSEKLYHAAFLRYAAVPLYNEAIAINANFNRAVMLRNSIKVTSNEELISSPLRKKSREVFVKLKGQIELYRNESSYVELYCEILYELARFDIEDNRFIHAESLIGEALAISNGMRNHRLISQGLYMIGDVQFHKKQYEKALDNYLSVLEITMDVYGDYFIAYQLYIHIAQCYAYLNDQYRSVEFLGEAETVAKLSGNDFFINEVQEISMSVTERFFGNVKTTERAVDHQTELIEAASRNPNFQGEWAAFEEILAYIEHQKYDTAMEEIEKLSKKYKGEDDVFFLLQWTKSNIFTRQRNFKETIRSLKYLLELRPNSSFVLLNLGNAYGSIKDLKNAELCFIKAIDARGGFYPLASANLSLTYIELRDKKRAQEHYQKAKMQNGPQSQLERIEQLLSKFN